LGIGYVAGAVVGVVIAPGIWMALLALPMVVEIALEKGFGLGHRPWLVAWGSALAGVALGATMAWLLVAGGPMAAVLTVAAVWILAFGVTGIRRRRRLRLNDSCAGTR
jgi:hypothetical protein